jgi:hypothetical protein
MRCFRIASNSLHIFTYVSLTLFLFASSVAAATHTESSSNVIRVWTVGSPLTGVLPRAVVPRELRQRAESLGYTVEVEAFLASGFAAKFRQALQDHTEPEILSFDNYGVISGIQTPQGWVEGVDADRRVAPSLALVHETMTSLQSRGWVMLVRSAVNYEAARALSMRPAECDAQSVRPADSPIIDPALRQAQEKAVFATRAYLDCDRSTLSAISDESRLVQQCFKPESVTKVDSVKACRVSGNHKLAFVSLVSLFSAETLTTSFRSPPGMDLGQQSILAVLRNEGDTWRLLAITHDPMNTWARIPLTTAGALVTSLDQGRPAGLTPEPARPLTPDGIYPLPQRNERFGDFIWHPSQSTDVIGQIVEFTWGRDTNWGLTRLFFLPAGETKLSSGLLMSGGRSVWRVWSISKTGDIAFSEQHSFMH